MQAQKAALLITSNRCRYTDTALTKQKSKEKQTWSPYHVVCMSMSMQMSTACTCLWTTQANPAIVNDMVVFLQNNPNSILLKPYNTWDLCEPVAAWLFQKILWYPRLLIPDCCKTSKIYVNQTLLWNIIYKVYTNQNNYTKPALFLMCVSSVYKITNSSNHNFFPSIC